MITKLLLVITYYLVCVVFGNGAQNSSCIDIVSRQEWRAITAPVEHQDHPVQYVIIIHTVSEPCTNLILCSSRLRTLQQYHMGQLALRDISSK